MNFINLQIKKEYRSKIDNIIKDFYIPVLNNSISYQRAVGFFSSTSLAEISHGIYGLLENKGYIQLVASPLLSDEDVDAIKKGYEKRNKIIEQALLKTLREPKNLFEKERLNLLANLIADNVLDIKIAILEENQSFGMFHEKMGIFTDFYNNKIAFSGSMNETTTAMLLNYEAVDVFCSWKTEDEKERVCIKEHAFELIWNNKEDSMYVSDFPEVKEFIIQKYKYKGIDKGVDYLESAEIEKVMCVKEKFTDNRIRFPDDVELYDYQIDAIGKWRKENFKGIFDMATGTGKTYTGLGAIVELYNNLNGNLAVVIVCPYQHLVEQWIDDLNKFNIFPIIGYSSSPQSDWKKRLDKAVRNKNLEVKNYNFFCFICTNATYTSDFVQSEIKKIKNNVLIVVDEAHNFGSLRLRSMLLDSFDFRLALSATLERHNDVEGTDVLKNYFGRKCIEYTLEDAIENKKLTPYKYYPIIVHLNKSEYEVYKQLTKEISKCIITNKDSKISLNDRGKRLSIKRAQIVAAAEEKIVKLKENILSYKNEKHILVYCGAAKILGDSDDFTNIDEEDLRQIDVVTKMLGDELNMKVSQFTSKENIYERKILKNEFSIGERLQVLIAIKCLDEGVNIPTIRVAFILASTTNPKEYIQRRGRVLRRFPGKHYAEIYDFITLPRKLIEIPALTIEELNDDLSLVKKEIRRARDFAKIALNSAQADLKIDMIKNAYNLENESFEGVF